MTEHSFEARMAVAEKRIEDAAHAILDYAVATDNGQPADLARQNELLAELKHANAQFKRLFTSMPSSGLSSE